MHPYKGDEWTDWCSGFMCKAMAAGVLLFGMSLRPFMPMFGQRSWFRTRESPGEFDVASKDYESATVNGNAVGLTQELAQTMLCNICQGPNHCSNTRTGGRCREASVMRVCQHRLVPPWHCGSNTRQQPVIDSNHNTPDGANLGMHTASQDGSPSHLLPFPFPAPQDGLAAGDSEEPARPAALLVT